MNHMIKMCLESAREKCVYTHFQHYPANSSQLDFDYNGISGNGIVCIERIKFYYSKTQITSSLFNQRIAVYKYSENL
jgi:hypothetical protein